MVIAIRDQDKTLELYIQLNRVIWLLERLSDLRVYQLLPVWYHPPRGDAQRYHFVERQRWGSSGVIPHCLSHTPANTFTQARCDNPRSWGGGGGVTELMREEKKNICDRIVQITSCKVHTHTTVLSTALVSALQFNKHACSQARKCIFPIWTSCICSCPIIFPVITGRRQNSLPGWP